jgi:hypothetical protein
MAGPAPRTMDGCSNGFAVRELLARTARSYNRAARSLSVLSG